MKILQVAGRLPAPVSPAIYLFTIYHDDILLTVFVKSSRTFVLSSPKKATSVINIRVIEDII